MEGMIPCEFGDLENLEWLDLSNNLFFARGTIRPELGNLRKLRRRIGSAPLADLD